MPKYSYMVSELFGYHVRNINRDLNEQKEFEAATSFLKELGYHGIIIPLMFNMDVLVKKVKEIVDSHQIKVSGLATDHYYTSLDYHLTNPNSAVKARALDMMMSGISVSSTFSAPLIIGLIRGGNMKDERSSIWLHAALKILDKKAKDMNVQILIEPLNHYETNHVNSIAEAYDLIDSLGLEKTGILINSYHMNIEERDYEQPIIYAKDRIWHVKFSDTNRLAPGLGHIDFNSIVNSLKKIGYDGWYSVECLPRPNSRDAATVSISFLKKMVV
ncbi:MAG: sugar phosphate isomerase/epimerase family protein [Nitrososphaeria archaeon]